MKHVLILESFGGLPGRRKNGSWVAEVKISPSGSVERSFLRAHKNYENSNSVGTRGVRDYYNLEEGKLYEIHDPKGWTKFERYFAIHDGSGLIRLTFAEAKTWMS